MAAHREDVQQRAALGELAVLVDRIHAAVAVAFQVAAEGVQVECLPGFQHQAVAGDVFARGQSVHQGGHRHHQDAVFVSCGR